MTTGLSYIMPYLPRGGSLSTSDWNARHRGILLVLWSRVLGVPLFGVYMGSDLVICGGASLILASLALTARLSVIHCRIRSVIATCGLMTASAMLVHLSGGYIELHFHFFVMIAVVVLYQDWGPFLFGILFIIADHGLTGTLMPTMVYNHHAGQSPSVELGADPWHFHPGRMRSPHLLLARQ